MDKGYEGMSRQEDEREKTGSQPLLLDRPPPPPHHRRTIPPHNRAKDNRADNGTKRDGPNAEQVRFFAQDGGGGVGRFGGGGVGDLEDEDLFVVASQ